MAVTFLNCRHILQVCHCTVANCTSTVIASRRYRESTTEAKETENGPHRLADQSGQISSLDIVQRYNRRNPSRTRSSICISVSG